MLKKTVTFSLSIALFTLLVGCQSAPRQVTYHNQQISLPAKLERIAIFNYGALDTVDALGGEQQVIGVAKANLPDYLSQYKQAHYLDIGGLKKPNSEALQSSQPELIISDPRLTNAYAELAQIAPTLKITIDGQDYFSSVKENIRLIGEILQKSEQAEQQIGQLEQKISQVKAKLATQPPSAIIALHNDGKLMLINQGAHASLIYDVLGLSRAVAFTPELQRIKPENSGSQRPAPTFVTNAFLAKYPAQIIYIIDRSKAIGAAPMVSNYFDAARLAKQQTKVVYLSADLWYLSGGGIESLNRQIDEVAKGL